MTSLHPPSFHRNDFSTCILFDGTRAQAVYTCQQSQFFADRLVASAGKPFPRCAGQLVAKGKGKRRAAARGIYAGSGREQQGGARPLVHTYTHAHTAN